MIRINYPPYEPRIKKSQEKEFIFDVMRKRWVALTPEEWVRQHFLNYLTGVMNYPQALIAVERAFNLGELKKRFDIVIYDRDLQPWMLIECKEMQTALDKNALDQVLRYHIILRVPYIVITNGRNCFGFSNQNGQVMELSDLPPFGASLTGGG